MVETGKVPTWPFLDLSGPFWTLLGSGINLGEAWSEWPLEPGGLSSNPGCAFLWLYNLR